MHEQLHQGRYKMSVQQTGTENHPTPTRKSSNRLWTNASRIRYHMQWKTFTHGKNMHPCRTDLSKRKNRKIPVEIKLDLYEKNPLTK